MNHKYTLFPLLRKQFSLSLTNTFPLKNPSLLWCDLLLDYPSWYTRAMICNWKCTCFGILYLPTQSLTICGVSTVTSMFLPLPLVYWFLIPNVIYQEAGLREAIRLWATILWKTKWPQEVCLTFYSINMELEGIIHEGDSLSSDTQIASIFIFTLQSLEMWKLKSMLFICYQAYGILLQYTKQAKRVCWYLVIQFWRPCPYLPCLLPKKTCSIVHIAAFFTIAKMWKQVNIQKQWNG